MTPFNTLSALGATLAVASLALASSPAKAQTSDAPAIVSVNYADLDITHAPGARVLIGRIEAASERVCGGALGGREPGERAAVDQCRKDAVSRAIGQINPPLFSALTGEQPRSVNVANR